MGGEKPPEEWQVDRESLLQSLGILDFPTMQEQTQLHLDEVEVQLMSEHIARNLLEQQITSSMEEEEDAETHLRRQQLDLEIAQLVNTRQMLILSLTDTSPRAQSMRRLRELQAEAAKVDPTVLAKWEAAQEEQIVQDCKAKIGGGDPKGWSAYQFDNDKHRSRCLEHWKNGKFEIEGPW